MKNLTRFLLCFALIDFATVATGNAQCPAPVFASGLRAPTKVIFSQKNNLLVAEQGTGVPNTGRISIIDPQSAAVRTLLDGLPSALNLLGEQPAPSGPSGSRCEAAPFMSQLAAAT